MQLRYQSYAIAKRILDVGIALIVLVLFAPAWLAIALLIRTTDPGPVLFRREVIGEGGRLFSYYKFRSMRSGDDSHHREWLREYVLHDSPYRDGRFKVTDDPRITPVGRILRRTSLDEIPQLLNVLRGEMSIVGPRPPIVYEYSLYDKRAKGRLRVKPGITGLYQVTARGAAPFSEMLELDLEYIRRRSLALDLWIIAKTPIVMLSGRGAA